MSVQPVVFLSGLMASMTLSAFMISTVLSSIFRFWPPGEKDWRWLTYWTLATVNSLSILYLVVEGLRISSSIPSIFGSLLAFSGLFVASKAIRDLSLDRTSGLEKNFVEKGLYSYSRNPQVLGNLLTLLGVVVIRATVQLSFLSVVTGLWLVSMIFAEEEWLEEKYGEEYLEYMGDVPRFLSTQWK